MKRRIPLAWLQVSRERSRLVVAMAGIAFADMLMFMQLGFRTALYDSNTQMHRSLRADLVMVSPLARNIVSMSHFPRRRLYQARGFAGVQSVDALYTESRPWKNPQTRHEDGILFLGFNPEKSVFNLPEVDRAVDQLKQPDTVIFDRGSRGEYATAIAALDKGNPVQTEYETRRLTITGLFKVGASFAADGNVITSDQTFLRIFPDRKQAEISAGLITLQPGIDPKQMAQALQANLPNDVKVMTLHEFAELEKAYWANNTPIGFIFSLGTVIGFVVGTVIVYQILSSDVTDHLAEYATLKAMGFRDGYLLLVVFQEALILAILGFIPGYAISVGLYGLTRGATNLPLFMTLSRALMVLVLTVVMCLVSGAIATRKLRSADPAEVF
ncbi:ABC transporter permease DevC [Kovacikia minuta CCNUW1]|uniref:ABC transporter permease DevC n=1 Tax=Kovacikia minuta TaxID=2931930 RepID=UPI001CCE03C5|nr:ABC transporter permease DevC [Kovacikia minuta]UBF23560.1 ABC transporter permease DevC [Kovacikia minuta CCNUW1]